MLILKKIEKEKDYENNREYWIDYLDLNWLKMIENIKFVMMEIDSIKHIKDLKKTGEYDIERQKDQDRAKNGKLEFLQIKSVNYLLIYYCSLKI